jgi:uncharacterized protein YaaQ
MKLIFTIISDTDNEPVSQALITAGFRVTRIASTGGFFRRGSSTLVMGVDDDKVDPAIEVVRKSVSPTPEHGLHGATIFVLNVEDYTQI